MLFIKRLLSTTNLVENPRKNYSIACISTSRPVYLVFGAEPDCPKYVIRKLTNDHERQAHRTHVYLYSLVGNLVPKPIGICEYLGDKYDIQEGVKGIPWFQIKSKYGSENALCDIELRLWCTLKNFQSSVDSESSINTSFQPHEELSKVYGQYKTIEKEVNPDLEKLVETATEELSKMSSCAQISQHGDFCLNNVIVDTSHITVIDFEDFGITKMPLYDHFTLALSLSNSPDPEQAVKVLTEARVVEAAAQLGIPRIAIRWHFLHHILLRLGPWSAGEKRVQYRAWLKQVLDNYTEFQVRRTIELFG